MSRSFFSLIHFLVVRHVGLRTRVNWCLVTTYCKCGLDYRSSEQATESHDGRRLAIRKLKQQGRERQR